MVADNDDEVVRGEGVELDEERAADVCTELRRLCIVASASPSFTLESRKHIRTFRTESSRPEVLQPKIIRLLLHNVKYDTEPQFAQPFGHLERILVRAFGELGEKLAPARGGEISGIIDNESAGAGVNGYDGDFVGAEPDAQFCCGVCDRSEVRRGASIYPGQARTHHCQRR